MKRITAVLRTSEATEVRKAIFAAAGDRIVVTTVSHRLCAIELADWHCGMPDADRDRYVRLSVTVEDFRAQQVVSAIIATAHAGMIEKSAYFPTKKSRVSSDVLAECAA